MSNGGYYGNNFRFGGQMPLRAPMGQPLQQFVETPPNYWNYPYGQPSGFGFPQGPYQFQPMPISYIPPSQSQAPIGAPPSGGDSPQVSIEINLILNDQNLSSLTSKIPFLRILVDKGVVGGSQTQIRADIHRLPENVSLGKRPNLPDGNDPSPVAQTMRPPEPEDLAPHMEPPINENGGCFTQLKDEIDKILDKEIGSQNLQGTTLKGVTPGPFRNGSISANGERKPSGPTPYSKFDTQFKPPPTDTFRQFSAINGQFSFQKIIEGNDYSNGQPGQSSLRFFSNRKHINDVDAIKLEMEKICQNQSRTIRGFWENRQEPQPYIFKQKSLVKTEENQDGIITEKVDFSNKRIAEGDSRKMSAEHSRESEGEEGSDHSESNNNSF